MAASLFSRLFSAAILVDYDGVVEQVQAAEASERQRTEAGEWAFAVGGEPGRDERERQEESRREAERVAAALLPKPIANRKSILTTNDGELLRSMEGRPLAEPLNFNYDWFVREVVPSDDKLKSMFPTDPAQRTTYRDLLTERGLLYMFEEWTDDMRKESAGKRVRNSEKFYENLMAEIDLDLKQVDTEYESTARSFSHLIRWEQEFLDNDPKIGHTASLKKRLKRGEDPFTNYLGGPHARYKYGYLLSDRENLPWPPAHDLDTWEYYQLCSDKTCTTKVEELIWKYFNERDLGVYQALAHDEKDASNPSIFTKAYFGGEEARKKWGYLAELGSWEWRHLDNDGGTLRIRKSLEDGRANVFTRTGGDLARAKYTPLFAELLRDARHDLDTWRRFQLDADGVHTTKIEQKIRAKMDSGEGCRDFFSDNYYGGEQAREAYGYLCWEAETLDESGGTTEVEDRLSGGEDVFQGWEGESALPKYRHLLNKLPHLPLHNLETWEAYNLDTDGGTTNIAKWLEKGTKLFEPTYYGGIQARRKYGWMYWACENLSTKGFRSACKSGKLNSSDSKQLEKRLLAGEDIFHSWHGASAKVKFGCLLDALSRLPRHDLETWEWFHVPGDSTEKAEAELKAYKDIFDPNYYGGVEARKKWGHLAAGFVQGNWDGPIDLALRESMQVAVEAEEPPEGAEA